MAGPVAPRVLVAGGGPAALEAVLAVRARIPAADAFLVAPDRELVYRPLAVGEAFGERPPSHFRLAEIADHAGARLVRDALTAVSGDVARFGSGRSLRFDALLIAIGSRRIEAVTDAITFWGRDGDPAFARALAEVVTSDSELRFVSPPGVAWTLPIYELAIASAERVPDPSRLRVATAESEPLESFGGPVSERMREVLAELGMRCDCGCGRIPEDRGPSGETTETVALPRLAGRCVSGLPVDDGGFLEVDQFGRCAGRPRVYAAGDVTTVPIKQGGLATQQAEAAVAALAHDLGLAGKPDPPERRLRARLEIGGRPAFLERDLDAGPETSSWSDIAPWQPAGKIQGKRLGPFLAALASLGSGGPLSANGGAGPHDLRSFSSA